MGWLLFCFFLVLFSLTGYIDHRQSLQQERTQAQTVTKQRAIDTVRLINAINDYIYDNPDVINSEAPVTLSPGTLGIAVDAAINNVIFNRRVYVWQMPEPGLMHALKVQTVSSALLGVVKNRRLFDNTKSDMTVSVPPQIPDSAIVYLN
jgi:hypothetical protein